MTLCPRPERRARRASSSASSSSQRGRRGASRPAARSRASAPPPGSPSRTARAARGSTRSSTPRSATASAAIDTLAGWLRSSLPGRPHRRRRAPGGPRRPAVQRADRGHARDPRRTGGLTPLAPLHQPHNLAPIEAIFDRMPDVPQVAVSTPASTAATPRSPPWCRCPANCARAGSSGTGSTASPTSTSPRSCPKSPPRLPRAAVDRGPPGQRRQHVCDEGPQERRHDDELHGRGRAVHGYPAGGDRPRHRALPVPELGLSVKQVEDVLYKKSGLLGISGISNDMRDLLGQERAGGPPGGGLLRLSERPRRSAPWPRSSAGSTRWCSPPGSARTRPRSAGGSARRAPGSGSNWTTRPTPPGAPAFRPHGARRRPG